MARKKLTLERLNKNGIGNLYVVFNEQLGEPDIIYGNNDIWYSVIDGEKVTLSNYKYLEPFHDHYSSQISYEFFLLDEKLIMNLEDLGPFEQFVYTCLIM